uniref:MSP domain-containing protein n=1 Tax=Steinernema glaseri TaxID=37863 RepID=A0A1I7Y816_9BILA
MSPVRETRSHKRARLSGVNGRSQPPATAAASGPPSQPTGRVLRKRKTADAVNASQPTPTTEETVAHIASTENMERSSVAVPNEGSVSTGAQPPAIATSDSAAPEPESGSQAGQLPEEPVVLAHGVPLTNAVIVANAMEAVGQVVVQSAMTAAVELSEGRNGTDAASTTSENPATRPKAAVVENSAAVKPESISAGGSMPQKKDGKAGVYLETPRRKLRKVLVEFNTDSSPTLSTVAKDYFVRAMLPNTNGAVFATALQFHAEPNLNEFYEVEDPENTVLRPDTKYKIVFHEERAYEFDNCRVCVNVLFSEAEESDGTSRRVRWERKVLSHPTLRLVPSDSLASLVVFRHGACPNMGIWWTTLDISLTIAYRSTFNETRAVAKVTEDNVVAVALENGFDAVTQNAQYDRNSLKRKGTLRRTVLHMLTRYSLITTGTLSEYHFASSDSYRIPRYIWIGIYDDKMYRSLCYQGTMP